MSSNTDGIKIGNKADKKVVYPWTIDLYAKQMFALIYIYKILFFSSSDMGPDVQENCDASK